MSTYNEIISLKLPADLLDIASRISRALDTDVGGYDSWTIDVITPAVPAIDDTPAVDAVLAGTISTTALCTSSYKQQADYLLEHPADLFAFVSQDYATRWPDLTAPTLAECEQFCAGVIRPPEPEPEPGPEPEPEPDQAAAQDPQPAP